MDIIIVIITIIITDRVKVITTPSRLPAGPCGCYIYMISVSQTVYIPLGRKKSTSIPPPPVLTQSQGGLVAVRASAPDS